MLSGLLETVLLFICIPLYPIAFGPSISSSGHLTALEFPEFQNFHCALEILTPATYRLSLPFCMPVIPLGLTPLRGTPSVWDALREELWSCWSLVRCRRVGVPVEVQGRLARAGGGTAAGQPGPLSGQHRTHQTQDFSARHVQHSTAFPDPPHSRGTPLAQLGHAVRWEGQCGTNQLLKEPQEL